jgi:hypothetical protein
MATTRGEAGARGQGPRVALAALVDQLGSLAAVYEGCEIDPDLVRARLADALRDAGAEPAPAAHVAGLFARLDEQGGRRLAVLVEALRSPSMAGAVGSLCLLPSGTAVGVAGAARAAGAAGAGGAPASGGPRGATALVERGLFGLALATPLLTLSLVRQSPLRLEELARRWIAALGARVEGETPEASAEQLARLDYERLLGEAEQARVAAEERANYLRKLQEAREKKRPRGKW